MNIVAIDPSLSCTALVVNDKKYVYTTTTVAHTKKGDLKRWFQECEDQGVTIRVYDPLPGDTAHSTLELMKIDHYTRMVEDIVHDIASNFIPREKLVIGIEGYSYSSAAGPLIDLVTFGTLLRKHLRSYIGDFWNSFGEVKILQPTEVKAKAAELVYLPVKKGKKLEYRNAAGISGGSFKKPQIYQALIDNPKLKDDPWVIYLLSQADEILEMKSIPKPIEDINDAKTLYEILKAPHPLDK